MDVQLHAHYRRLVDLAQASHQQGRNPSPISEQDIGLARLYAYLFRGHVIGAFHATRVALEQRPPVTGRAADARTQAVDGLVDLADLTMDDVPSDYRAVISLFHRYHRGLTRVLSAIHCDAGECGDREVATIAHRFQSSMESITSSCGIRPTQDTEAPDQASFVVPGLGIRIVPLVYGDRHSWNLAYLDGEASDVPIHRHQHGVEIHLGYDPTHGETVLGNCRTRVDEGYAMPIPPQTDHGWVNTSDTLHHVPFIFGSLQHAGWGVFFDVEPVSRSLTELRTVARDSPAFNQMIDLEKEMDRAARMASSWHSVLIPHTVTSRGRSGGLQLGMARVNPGGFTFPSATFRIVAAVRGRGRVEIDGIGTTIQKHDHFGIPAGMTCTLHQSGDEPLVVLDTLIRPTA